MELQHNQLCKDRNSETSVQKGLKGLSSFNSEKAAQQCQLWSTGATVKEAVVIFCTIQSKVPQVTNQKITFI